MTQTINYFKINQTLPVQHKVSMFVPEDEVPCANDQQHLPQTFLLKKRPLQTGFKIAVRAGLLPHYKYKLKIVCFCI